MARSSDIQVRIDSSADTAGFKSAEASARILARELDKLEAQQRAMVQQEMAAYREQGTRAQAAQAAVVRRGQVEAQAYAENQSRSAEAERRTRSMAAAEAAAYREQEEMARQAAAAEEAASARRAAAMQTVGTALVGVGAAAAAGLGLAARSAVQWESAWAGVEKTVDGSPEQMAALEAELRDLAKTLPATHEEIAGVAEAAGQLGVGREDIASFAKTAIDMGESTNLSAEAAATGLAQLGNVMGVLPSEADRAGSALVALGNNGASTEADILAMSLRLAGAGRTIGLTEAQVLGLSSGLANVGIEAEAGGSALSRVMVDIAQSVETGDAKLATFAETAGMSTTEFSAAFRDDAGGAVVSFVEGLGRIQSAGGDVFGTLDQLELSEIRVRDALLRSASAGDMLRASLEMGTQAWAANSALVEEASKRYETSESRIAMARNAINDAAISIGSTVLPALAGAAEGVAGIADAFSKLPQPAQAAVAGLGGIVATVGLVGGGMLLLIPRISETVTAMRDLSSTSPRASKAVAGLGRAAGIAAGVAALGTALAVVADVTGVEGTALEVNALADAVDRLQGGDLSALNVQFDNFGSVFSAEQASDVNTMADAFDRLFSYDGVENGIDDWLEKVAEKSGIATSEVTLVKDRFADLDSQLAGMVSGGSADEAAAAFERIGQVAERQGVSVEELNSLFPQYGDALVGAARQAEESAEGSQVAAEGVAAVGVSAEAAEDALSAFQEALKAIFDNAFGVEEATDAITGSLAELSENTGEYARTLDGTSEAALANRESVRGLVQGVLDLADAQARTGSSSDEITSSMQRQKEALGEALTAMGFNAEQVARYASAVDPAVVAAEALAAATGQIPKQAATQVTQPGMDAALDKARVYGPTVDGLPPKATTVFTQPGMAKSQADASDLTGRVRGIPGSKASVISAPGAVLAAEQALTVTGRVRGIPSSKASMISTPGAILAAAQASNADRAVRDILSSKTTTISVDDQISARVRAAQAVIDGLRGKTVNIVTNRVETTTLRTVRGSSARSTVSAAGNLFGPGHDVVRAYAGGGVRDPRDVAEAHPPHLAPAGSYRLFGESETGGEVYLPLADDWRRPRAVELLDETAERFGFDLVKRFAGGGMWGAGSPPVAAGPVSVAAPVVRVFVQAVPDGPWVRSQARVEVEAYDRAETAAATYNPGAGL